MGLKRVTVIIGCEPLTRQCKNSWQCEVQAEGDSSVTTGFENKTCSLETVPKDQRTLSLTPKCFSSLEVWARYRTSFNPDLLIFAGPALPSISALASCGFDMSLLNVVKVGPVDPITLAKKLHIIAWCVMHEKIHITGEQKIYTTGLEERRCFPPCSSNLRRA